MVDDTQRRSDDSVGAAAGSEPAAAEPAVDKSTEEGLASSRSAAAAVAASAAAPDGGREARTSWTALLAAGLIGGAVVAAAAGAVWYATPSDDSGMSVVLARLGAVELATRDLSARAQQPAGDSHAAADVAARIGKVEAALAALPAAAASASEPAAVADLAARIGKVESSVASLQAAPPAPAAGESPGAPEGGAAAPDLALVGRLVAVEATVKSLTEDLTRLDRRAEETALGIKDLGEKVDAVRRTASDAATPPAPAVDKAEIDALAARIAASEKTTATLEKAQAALQQAAEKRAAAPLTDRAVRLALAAASLRSAVERGAPFASDLNAAKALASDPQAFAPVEPFAAAGVPTAAALGRELLALTPGMTQAIGVVVREGNYLERLQSHAERLVRIRPVNETPGEDALATIARIEARAKQGDIAGALAAIAKLPESARAPAAPWIRKAEAREAAIAAVQRVESAALAALAN